MSNADRLDAMARFMWDARTARRAYSNLPANLHPVSIAEAYAAQEVYYRLAEPVYGAVAGAKIATTTRVMQELMGITHPCGGAIFARTIHASPAKLGKADFVNLRIESEIALKLGADLPASGAPWSADSVTRAVAGAMPAYELIEDRNAVYTETNAVSMIVENCWNGGIVTGAPQPVTRQQVAGIMGRQTLNGKLIGEGKAEDPFATLAWLANQLAARGRGLTAGMVVITGSLIPTFSVQPGDHIVFAVDGLGEAVLDII
jgi:2-keto-4-pentenoate hydratase